MNNQKIEAAKQVSILTLFPNKNQLKKSGDKYMARCPFHKEDHPSFAYYPETNSWNCFAGCGGGTSIDFVMKMFNVDFNEAVERLIKI